MMAAQNTSRAPKGSAQMSASATRWEEIAARGWALMQRLGRFGYGEVQVELSISDAAARRLVRDCLADGRIEVLCGGNGSRRKTFTLTEPHRPPADRSTAQQAQLWRAARGLKVFTPTDLVAHCTPEVAAGRDEASLYCQSLLRAGYLTVVQTAIPGRRDARYRLVRDSGPLAPRERRVRAVWDENLGELVYVAGAGRIGGEA